jgi:DNA repair ATPase RecN
MTNDELNTVRAVFREEANALRLSFREEINAAVYASETRIMARLDQIEGRLDRLEDRVSQLEVGQQKIRVELSETIEVLNQATQVINDIQRSQHALEERVEDNTLTIKRDVQKLMTIVHNFAKEFVEMNGATNDRITEHERMSLDQAHRRPHSAA